MWTNCTDSELCTFFAALEEEFLPTSSSDTGQCAPLKSSPTASGCLNNDKKTDSCHGSRSGMTSAPSTDRLGMDSWICSAWDSLARIFQPQENKQESTVKNLPYSFRRSKQLTLFNQNLFSSKIHQTLEQRDGEKSSRNSWREDIPGATERLQRLTSVLGINETGGGYLLPTLTVKGNYNRNGLSEKSGDGIITALKTLPTLTAKVAGGDRSRLSPALKILPTLCTTDYKSPYSKDGWTKQAEIRSKPLQDTLPHHIGHLLTPAFAEWWMGFPISWTATKPRE